MAAVYNVYQKRQFWDTLLTHVPKRPIMVHMKPFDPAQPYNELPLLPPEVHNIETVNILKKERDAVAAIGELKGIANIIPNQAILINAIVLRESQDSSEIENIITTQDELYQAVSVSGVKTDPATKEVMYYREALYNGFDRIHSRHLLSVSDITEIQKILVKNDAGIRTLSGTALFNDKTGTVIYTPPDNQERIQLLLSNFVNYLNEGPASLTKMAVLHYQFESIHPFYDGNGRTGRIINILYLILNGFLDIPVLYLSSYITRNKARYYTLLNTVTREQQWEQWILFMLQGIEETARETIDKIRKIRYLMDTTIEIVRKKLPGIYSRELVESLFVNPYSKVEFIVKAIPVERKAASRYLHQLEEIGILAKLRIGKENIFINTALIDLLKS